MKAGSGKRPRIRLDANTYQVLRKQILERDGWRCLHCGSISGLEVHHIQRRSQQGEDTDENLISLCSECHRAMHA
jgi:5-methylcytosine-specific restriction endonuclease McrA